MCARYLLQALTNNRRIQTQNNVPPDFPAFVRQGYDIKILADDYVIDDKGLIYKVNINKIACFPFANKKIQVHAPGEFLEEAGTQDKLLE